MTKRNQPCPCGSNSKYKKCCGSTQKIDQDISPAEKEVLLNLFNSKQMIKTEQACRELMQTYQQSSYLFNLLGITLKEQSKLREAEQAFEKATQIKPDYASAYCNRGIALRYLGQLDEAVQSMQIAVEKDPDDSHISDSLINILNYYMPNIETGYPYIKAQKSLQQVRAKYTSRLMIADETVRQLYQQCHSILGRNNLLAIYTNKNQLYRGASPPNDCARHKMVFDTFNIIPEYCFDCYKVTFEPRTVMELFKLLLVFDKLKLPNNNERKCIVENRPEMSGTYKGFIYCRSLDEGKEILNIVQPIVGNAISEGIPIFVKRGCSEFPLAYPAYGHITKNKSQQMSYNEEWRKHEAYADKNMTTQKHDNPNDFKHNHSGFTLLDILVMRKWLAFAAKRGDLSYLKIVE
ncbi:MAG: tetratricopeptide repeat protein [Thermodesulfobacteriota bacterium]